MTALDPHAQAHGHAEHGDDHGHGHGQYPFLAHHFATPAQQFDAGKLGMWLFLATEVLFFGGLFAMYAIMRYREPEVFSYASGYLNTIMGGINTCVLILSSVTMAAAVHFAQRSKKGPLVACLFLTFLGACGFLVIKYFEYTHKFHENLVWGPGFYVPVAGEEGHGAATPHAAASGEAAQKVAFALPTSQGAASTPLVQMPAVDASTIKKAPAGPAGVATPGEEAAAEHAEAGAHVYPTPGMPHLDDPKLPVDTHRFFAIYYCMTGLHGIHVVVGMFIILWLMFGAMAGKYNKNYFTPIDLGGLYWHIVDLIWIFLFPLFYLIH